MQRPAHSSAPVRPQSAESKGRFLLPEIRAMNVRIKQLRDLVVSLDRADRKLEPLDPQAYRAAAQKALAMTREEMGLLPIGDFAGPVNSLQTLAENLFFGINGCFADLDGTGRAPVARLAAQELLGRLRARSSP
jgi:hypothetical protein